MKLTVNEVRKRLFKFADPIIRTQEFHEKYAKDIVEDYYDNSILEFVRAYTAGHKLDDTEKTELSSYIQNL